jgi:hypothetical protein
MQICTVDLAYRSWIDKILQFRVKWPITGCGVFSFLKAAKDGLGFIIERCAFGIQHSDDLRKALAKGPAIATAEFDLRKLLVHTADLGHLFFVRAEHIGLDQHFGHRRFVNV